MMTSKRCQWVDEKDALMVQYHDTEWGHPEHRDQMLFELLSLETYQAGLSWRTVLHKRQAFRQAFANYDLEQVAQYTEVNIEQLMQDATIIRNRLKLQATINNAQAILALQQTGQTFDQWLWSFVDNQTIDHHVINYQDVPAKDDLAISVSKAMKKIGLKFVGPVTSYSFLQAAGLINDHEMTCPYHKK
jgi:DNA-3-methyladenine glycosylase I